MLLVLFVCLPIALIWKYAAYDLTVGKNIPELIYYSTQVIGSMSTVAAVVIALFGKEIRALIFNEHVSLSLKNNGFVENLGNTQNSPNPIVQSYDCILSIKNDGAKEFSEIQVLLKEVYFKSSKTSKYKRIFNSDDKCLYWNIPENTKTQLLRGESKRLPLFRIYPEDSCQTPDRSTFSSLRMRIIGCKLEESFSKKGIWKTTYQLQSNEKVLCTFECEVEWDGNWCNRLTEMSDGLNVVLHTIGL